MIDSKSLVSIIIINYNYGLYVADAIDSALDQTYHDIEVIVVDDGSTDMSRQVIASYKDRIISIYKENGGQASAANEGYRASSGDIVIFLDSDDLIHSELAENLAEVFADDIVKVHWPMWKINAAGQKTGSLLPDSVLTEGNFREQLITLGPAYCGGPPESPPTSGNAWSGEFLKHVMPIPEQEYKGGIDHYLFVLAPLYGKIKKIVEPRGSYRIHGTNTTLKPDYMATFFKRFESGCNVLSSFLLKEGIEVDPAMWPRDHWFHKVDRSMKEIDVWIPQQVPFILADDDAWIAGDTILQRKRYHLIEQEGQYWGIPKQDEEAIRAVEQYRKQGVCYLVLVWSSFWYLDYFIMFRHHLETHYSCIQKNDLLIIFDLHSVNSKTIMQ